MSENGMGRNFLNRLPPTLFRLVRFLVEGRSRFDGDLDSLLIMAVIAGRMLDAQNMSEQQAFAATGRVHHEVDMRLRAINAHALAQVTGIPRETVRRKVDRLIAQGWVMRDEQGVLMMTRKAERDLRDLTVMSVRLWTRVESSDTRPD